MVIGMKVPDRSLPRAFRIRRNGDFQRIFAARHSAADDVLVVFAMPNGLPHARVGVCVSRKFGSAVVRNRWKRRLREAFRLQRHDIPSGFDYVVLPRGSGTPSDAVFQDRFQQSLVQLAYRASRAAARS